MMDLNSDRFETHRYGKPSDVFKKRSSPDAFVFRTLPTFGPPEKTNLHSHTKKLYLCYLFNRIQL